MVQPKEIDPGRSIEFSRQATSIARYPLGIMPLDTKLPEFCIEVHRAYLRVASDSDGKKSMASSAITLAYLSGMEVDDIRRLPEWHTSVQSHGPRNVALSVATKGAQQMTNEFNTNSSRTILKRFEAFLPNNVPVEKVEDYENIDEVVYKLVENDYLLPAMGGQIRVLLGTVSPDAPHSVLCAMKNNARGKLIFVLGATSGNKRLQNDAEFMRGIEFIDQIITSPFPPAEYRDMQTRIIGAAKIAGKMLSPEEARLVAQSHMAYALEKLFV